MAFQLHSKRFNGCPHLRLRAGAAGGLAEMERISLTDNRVLTSHEQHQNEVAYMVYRAATNQLANLALEKNQVRWHVRPKSHILEHHIYDFSHLNLRYTSNYLDEDFVRRTKRVASVVHPRCVARNTLLRYCLAATLRWSDQVI